MAVIVAPKVPTRIGGTTVVPSGFRIEILAPQHEVFPIVTLLRRRLTRCVAVPLNVSVAFWPGVGASVRLTGPPPIAIVPVRSGGTS